MYTLLSMMTITYITTVHSDPYNTEDVCVYFDYVGKKFNPSTHPPSNNPICHNYTFKLSIINFPPYAQQIDHYSTKIYRNDLGTVLQKCCGGNVSYKLRDIDGIEWLDESLLEVSDFVYPILSTLDTEKLHGFHFLPYEDPPGAFYITKKVEPNLLNEIGKLHPIIITCLLFALISGFFAWLIETWSNKDEFPRNFMSGWFEGFWWSFVSMTTVGYGDKSPKSIPAKLFAILWIFIGIIACGLITGKITGEILKVDSPPPEMIEGRKVGVLKNREYDFFVVAQHGGIIIQDNSSEVSFNKDVLNLITKLKDEKVDGIVLEKKTLGFITEQLKDVLNRSGLPESHPHYIELRSPQTTREKIKFFLYDTIRTKKDYYGEKLSYGILIKHTHHYEFFKQFIHNSRYRNAIVDEINWSEFLQAFKDDQNSKIYSDDDSLLFGQVSVFKDWMTYIGLIIGFILLFGLLYELERKYDIFKTWSGRILPRAPSQRFSHQEFNGVPIQRIDGKM